MSNPDLIQRQQQLLLRSAQLRLTLTDQTEVFRRPLSVIDATQSGLQWLYRNPQWPLAALTLVVLLRPQRAVVWGGRLWWAWKTFKRVQGWLARPAVRQDFRT